MKSKRFLSLFIAIILCLSSFTAFAYDAKEDAQTTSEEIIVEVEKPADDPTEEIVAMPEDEDDGSIDYSDMSNWAYWNEGNEKKQIFSSYVRQLTWVKAGI